MQNKLEVTYATWKLIASTNSFATYHLTAGTNARQVFTGDHGMVYIASVGPTDYSDWNTNFGSSSTAVTTENDGIARVIGLSFKGEPLEDDGKRVFVNSPSTEGWATMIMGAGDDLDPETGSGRGTGTKVIMEFTGPDTKELTLDLMEPWEMHDGHIGYYPVDNWKAEDRWEFRAKMPANTPVVNGSNEGNCNLVDAGDFNVIVPAAGDGTHDITLSTAVPVPADNDGYWDVAKADGAVTVSTTPGSAKWHLIDAEKTAYLCRNMPLGAIMGKWDYDNPYKAEWLHPLWKMIVKVVKTSSGAGTVFGWIMVFRPGGE